MQHHTSFPANKDEAEALAVTALSAIAADPKLLSRFMALTGIEPQNLRHAASEPGFLTSVTNFLMTDESTLVAFAANEGLRPESVARAHAFLSGPEAQFGE
ncbi:DUF3572 domain-containing protein [Tepidamorphus sp. 3E244]|uniref:DUF3572 domain-containing protein n=1 Tax=Tepidamorphus sp. 3E244 TaxID=3385498 RepID=UPI0038FCE6D4